MIKNMLNNPWFVGALGLFAAIYLGWSVMQPLYFSGQNSVEDVAVLAPGIGDEEALSPHLNTENEESDQLARSEIRWLHDVGRDPFAGMTDLSADPVGVKHPTVSALFISAGVRAAVVENRLVHVGDSVNQYVVTAIGADFVELRYKGDALRLHPEA